MAAAIFCKPVLDTRTDSTLESRNGTVFQNVEAVESLDTIEFTENTLIAVDEAQFFDASLLRLFKCKMQELIVEQSKTDSPFINTLKPLPTKNIYISRIQRYYISISNSKQSPIL